ncbi:olfactory receptor 5V1-like [Rhinatrema bivittatum]|uniref:olfactory receptor 5V1-like n=1 Tax=Rhinatrema bivittatum TaxID=194408 RepID=UPI00112E0283|nr:olfactory receptor 5V1-like [Rhinatrema bivittatum]
MRFSQEDNDMLIEGDLCHYAHLFGNLAVKTSKAPKAQLWATIALDIRRQSGIPRTGEQVAHRYRDIKAQLKVKIAERNQYLQDTGGRSPCPIRFIDMERHLMQRLGPDVFEGLDPRLDTSHLEDGCKNIMDTRNHSGVTEFLILGLSRVQEPQIFLFLIFLIVYLITLTGNLLIFTLINSDSRLHSPMYFFLANLSIVDLACVSVTVPKLLDNFLSYKKSISFLGCITQMYCFQFFIVVECYLLAAMAYDRYVAICYPLNYTLIMNRKVRVQLIAGCWLVGFINSVTEAVCVSTLDFCGPNIVDHFFCDIPPLYKLSCSSVSAQEIVFLVVVFFCGILPFLLVVISYVCIVSAVLKIRTSEGRRRTFSTCASHLIVVTLYYVSGTYCYMHPYSMYALSEEVKVIAVIYSVINPMLNPIIYSLRNKEVKGALKTLFLRKRVT